MTAWSVARSQFPGEEVADSVRTATGAKLLERATMQMRKTRNVAAAAQHRQAMEVRTPGSPNRRGQDVGMRAPPFSRAEVI
jgi:hypothetical protein